MAGHPVGRRRQIQKAETYTLILNSARDLFETKGFEKTTIRGVAVSARIASGTIYKHFNNKTSLLAAAFYDDLVRLHADAISTLPDHAGLKEKFLHMAGFNFRFYTARPALSREYLSHIALADSPWLARIQEFDDACVNTVAEMVITAQNNGEISKKKDCRYVAFSLMADYFFVLADQFLRGRTDDPDQLLGFLGQMIDQTIC